MHKGVADPLEVVAGEISDESILLCLDEFMVCSCLLQHISLATLVFMAQLVLVVSITGNWCGWCSYTKSTFPTFVQQRNCMHSDLYWTSFPGRLKQKQPWPQSLYWLSLGSRLYFKPCSRSPVRRWFAERSFFTIYWNIEGIDPIDVHNILTL